MSFKIIKQEHPPYEDYAHTFSEWQRKDDSCRWVGKGCEVEFPHNPGALEEKIDEAEGRRTIDNWGY